MAKSAAARAVQNALDTQEFEEGSVAHHLYVQAQNSAKECREAAREGDDKAAARAAEDTKFYMNSLAEIVKAAAREKSDRIARDKQTNEVIDEALQKINPRYEPGNTDYTHNCSSVVQAYELQRRGLDTQAGPRTGVSLATIGDTWGGTFQWVEPENGDAQGYIESRFNEPGARGIIYNTWTTGGAHVFNVENVGGQVRFVDGQPTPHRTDVAHYFKNSKRIAYMRTDTRPTPSMDVLKRFLQTEETT
ncbi:toxin glutamine deamidase domain-containing protein [Streptomyces sp. NPDC058268]|uniref:toxin glutamine deamidase domain-containing protein n=1 Tax=Streptomyces sp. NPDC058268 TaxID=3346413 RepID=UPI0036E94D79